MYKPDTKQHTIFICSLKLSLFAIEALGVHLENHWFSSHLRSSSKWRCPLIKVRDVPSQRIASGHLHETSSPDGHVHSGNQNLDQNFEHKINQSKFSIFFLFLAGLCGLWDFSSLTRDWTPGPWQWKSWVLTTGQLWNSPQVLYSWGIVLSISGWPSLMPFFMLIIFFFFL